MANRATLKIGSLEIHASKWVWEPVVMTLFAEDDKVVTAYKIDDDGPIDDDASIDDDDDPRYRLSYKAPLPVIKDRLELMGFTYNKAADIFQTAIEEEFFEFDDQDTPDEKALKNLTFEKSIEGFEYIVTHNLDIEWGYRLNEDGKYDHIPPHVRNILRQIEDEFWEYVIGDFRWNLRAAVEITDTNVELVYNLDEIVDSGAISVEDNLCQTARLLMAEEFSINHKIVVLTEGSSDRWAIQGALQLLYPHLTEYFSFMDFDAAKVPGSAGYLASTVKAFIGAGIVNRTVALFDNDTAAKDAIRPLDDIKIPPNMKVLRYPDLDLARDYPTLGPQGTVSMDVNGLACSLELYFGLDVLQDKNGSLYSIQWKGYIDGAKQYQGEVMEKKMLQARYAEKLEKCLADPKQIDNYDWSGMRIILDCLRSAFNGD